MNECATFEGKEDLSMFRKLCRALCFFAVAALVASPAGLSAQEHKDPDKKEPPKIDPKKPFDPKKLPGLDFDFPNFDELFKGLPLDPAQAKMLQEQLERIREMYKKSMEKG